MLSVCARLYTFSLPESAGPEIEPASDSGVGKFVNQSRGTGRAWEMIDGADDIDPNASGTSHSGDVLDNPAALLVALLMALSVLPMNPHNRESWPARMRIGSPGSTPTLPICGPTR